MLTASRPEAQKRLSWTPDTVSGRPALIAAVLAMSAPWSPTGETQPSTTSSIRVGSSFSLRMSISCIRPTTRSTGLVVWREPLLLPLPRGVRIASNTRASVAAIVAPVLGPGRQHNKQRCLFVTVATVATPIHSGPVEPRQARGHATRRRLLSAAVDELLDRGYAGLSMSAVARRAGVSRGAQQNYFPHKQTLVVEAVRHLARRQRDQIEIGIDAVPRGRARVQTGLDMLFTAYSGPLFAAVLELSLAARDDPELGQVVASEERATAKAMQETASVIFGESYPESREAADRWATALSTIRGVALLKLLGHPPGSVDRQWTATRRHLLALLA